jgi:branched-chain amino acid transport system permease protein
LIIGLTETLAEVYIGPLVGGGIDQWIAYVIALVFLLIRPTGLFGQRSVERV